LPPGEHDQVRVKKIYETSFTTETPMTELRTTAKSGTAPSANAVTRGTLIIMAPTTTSPTDIMLRLEDAMKGGGGIKPLSRDLKRVRWPLNFKLLGIKKYDGFTNPAEWLKVYQHTIEAPGGDSYIMANYLPICLSSSARTWLMGLPTGSVCPWSDLCR
jgi:hypothetical protein